MSNIATNSAKADELQRRLPHHAAQMEFAIVTAINTLRHARRSTAVRDDFARGYVKGVSDGLTLLRMADEAAERFREWCRAVTLEPGLCAITDAERIKLSTSSVSRDKALALLSATDGVDRFARMPNDELATELQHFIATEQPLSIAEDLLHEVARRLVNPKSGMEAA